MACDFSWVHYAECIEAIAEGSRYGGSIEMVHDLDLSVHNAWRAAIVEYKEGVKATYFVRLHANGYNALSSSTVGLLYRLRARGHTIGLHFEPDFYGESWKKALMQELALLSDAIRAPVTIVSQHEPSRSVLKLTAEPLPAEARVTVYGYGSAHYQGAKYISDSGARWREGCMCEHIGKHERLIVLTHPEWWFVSHPGEGY